MCVPCGFTRCFAHTDCLSFDQGVWVHDGSCCDDCHARFALEALLLARANQDVLSAPGHMSSSDFPIDTHHQPQAMFESTKLRSSTLQSCDHTDLMLLLQVASTHTHPTLMPLHAVHASVPSGPPPTPSTPHKTCNATAWNPARHPEHPTPTNHRTQRNENPNQLKISVMQQIANWL